VSKKVARLRKVVQGGKYNRLKLEELKLLCGIYPDEEEVKPPPEFFAVKKEVRVKQAEIRDLRKQWWQQHKDFDALVEEARREAMERYGSFDGAASDKDPDEEDARFAREKGSDSGFGSSSGSDAEKETPPAWVRNLAAERRGSQHPAHLGISIATLAEPEGASAAIGSSPGASSSRSPVRQPVRRASAKPTVGGAALALSGLLVGNHVGFGGRPGMQQLAGRHPTSSFSNVRNVLKTVSRRASAGDTSASFAVDPPALAVFKDFRAQADALSSMGATVKRLSV